MLGPLRVSWLLLAGVSAAACQERVSQAAAAQPARRIGGRVLEGCMPLAGARVGWQTAGERAWTDAQGRFTLRAFTAPRRLVASKEGYYIGGVLVADGEVPIEISLQRHTAADSPAYRWVSSFPDPNQPEQCGNCHRQIFEEWSTGAHAQAAVNPHFRNLYDGTDWHGNENVGWSLLAEIPGAAGVCYSCHAPSLEPDPRQIHDLRTVGGVAREGIHCDFCHKIAEVSVERVGVNHGRFAMGLVRPEPGRQLFFGPLDDDDRGNAVYAPLYRQSRYCASCHEGIVLGTHAYSEYSEWLASPAAKQGRQCQDCHMKPTGLLRNFAPGYGGIERDPRTLASHRSTRGDPATLAKHVSLDVDAHRTAAAIEVHVRVALCEVGHRLPTGYPDRALIVRVAAKDHQGRDLPLAEGPQLPALAGQGRPEEGGLAGQPGKMYAKMLQGLDGALPVPYWTPNRLLADTRLSPDQSDRLLFRFRPPEGKVQIVVQLLYRRFSKYLADQKSWPDNETLVHTRTLAL